MSKGYGRCICYVVAEGELRTRLRVTSQRSYDCLRTHSLLVGEDFLEDRTRPGLQKQLPVSTEWPKVQLASGLMLSKDCREPGL